MDRECRLIINADDVGWRAGRDRGIFRSIEQGVVTSVSLMTNGATFADAVVQLRRSGVGTGVHLNLSEGYSLTGVVAGLTDDSGCFLGKQRSRAVFAANAYDHAAAYVEMCAQVQRAGDGGIAIDHIDSHQHMFLFPVLTGMMIELCQQFSIAAVRLPLPAECALADPPAPLGIELDLYRRRGMIFRRRVRDARLFVPRGLWGMPYLDRMNERVLRHLLLQMPPGLWELMVHPGDEDSGVPFCGVERCREQQALIAASVRAALEQSNIVLTTFGDAVCAL